MISIKILHFCLQTTYNDYWGYQDNLLPKYQARLGHEVLVVTTNEKFGEDGKRVLTGTGQYTLKDGQRVIRLDYKKYAPIKIAKAYKWYRIKDIVFDYRPDFIMVHGLGNLSVLQIIKYVRANQDCRVIADSHLDEINCPVTKLKKRVYVYTLKLFNKAMQRYYTKVYGVTPGRMKFAQKIFGIKKDKLELLVMGGDDEKILYEEKEKIRADIRSRYQIGLESFLLITGGKLDKRKKVHLVLEALVDMKIRDISIMVFGKADAELETCFKPYKKYEFIKFIGWIPSDEIYNYFLSADLAVFPGTHSVLWEQAAACGLPAVYKYWEGMNHVDVGGNCCFLYRDSVEEIQECLTKLIEDKETYRKMKEAAETKGRKEFSYYEIAKRSLKLTE